MSKIVDRLQRPVYGKDEATGYPLDCADPSGCSWGDLESYVQGYVLGLCCCGQPWRIRQDVREYLELKDWHAENDFAPPVLTWDLLQNLEAAYHGPLLAYWLDAEEITEHGASIVGAWLTPAGKELLALLREADQEQDELGGGD